MPTPADTRDTADVIRDATFVHAAADYTAEELLLVYIAERFEAMADRMVALGHSRIGIFGSREHAIWLARHIDAMNTLPIVAFVDRPDRPHERRDIGVPVFSIGDRDLAGAIDTLLIADDRCEDALRDLAERHVPPGTLLWSIYNRLAIGGEPLPGQVTAPTAASEAEAKPAHDTSAYRVTEPARDNRAESRLAKLTAATVAPH